jgi:hypothetical protein
VQGSWMLPNTWIIGPTWTARIDLLRQPPGETRRGKQHVRNDGVPRNYRSARPARSGWHGEGWIASTPVSKLESDRPGKVDETRCDPRTHLFGHVMSQVIAGGPGRPDSLEALLGQWIVYNDLKGTKRAPKPSYRQPRTENEIAHGARALWQRSLHSSPRSGKPATQTAKMAGRRETGEYGRKEEVGRNVRCEKLTSI